MDRPSVTEMHRGGVYKMDRHTNCQKNGNATEIDKSVSDCFLRLFFTGTIMGYFISSISVAFPFFCTFRSIHFRGCWKEKHENRLLLPFLIVQCRTKKCRSPTPTLPLVTTTNLYPTNLLPNFHPLFQRIEPP